MVISKALNDAIDAGLLVTNVAQRAKPPRTHGGSQNIEAWAEPMSWPSSSTTCGRIGYLPVGTWRPGRACAGANCSVCAGRMLTWPTAGLAVRQALILVYTTPTVSTPKSHDARVINLDPMTIQVSAGALPTPG